MKSMQNTKIPCASRT